MKDTHHYQATITWTGNLGTGTSSYRAYERSHTIEILNKPAIFGSSDSSFRGDPSKHNPEELLIASLSACHLLWYLHLCADAGVVVVNYSDQATGVMVVDKDGRGYFTEVMLNPIVTVSEISMMNKAFELHERAREFCFIANSVNFPVKHHSTINVK
ncbi:OsmC family protein [Pseudocalidococcus azoricus]